MNPESKNSAHSSNANGEKQKHMDRSVRDMVSVLTNRLTNLPQFHKPGSDIHDQDHHDSENGVRIITLAGTNTGATMKGDLDDKTSHRHAVTLDEDDEEGFGAYVNSNFQGINNSIMMGGSYHTNDPGVHLDISDFFDRKDKPEKIGKKKGKAVSKSDHNDQRSD